MQEFDYSEFNLKRRSLRPTWKAYLKHAAFLIVTFCTMTLAGTFLPFGVLVPFSNVDASVSTTDFLWGFPIYYAQMVIEAIWLMFTDPFVLAFGLKFSLSVLFILFSHEMGHYVACRIYGVDATLPYFIPTPPLIGPAGTFGAFIKILSPLPSRKATFDIGVAGPIAGFVALVPVALLAFATFTNAPPIEPGSGNVFVFTDPLLFKLLAYLFGANLSLPMMPNPYYSASWMGLLVTALNLIPAGQLDGGHAIFAVLGERLHHWISRAAFAAMLVLSGVGLYFYNSPSGILFAILLGFLLRIKHPSPLDESPLNRTRIVVAFVTLLIFVVSFAPIPITID